MDGNAARREWQGDPPRPDPELERASIPGEVGQEVDSRAHDRRVEHLVGVFVVGRGHAFAELTVIVHALTLQNRPILER